MGHLAREAMRNRDAYEVDRLSHHMSSAAPTQKKKTKTKRDPVKGYKKNDGSEEWTNEGQSDDERFFSF